MKSGDYDRSRAAPQPPGIIAAGIEAARDRKLNEEFAAFVKQIKSAAAAKPAINPEVIAANMVMRSLREIRAELAEATRNFDPTEQFSDDHRVWSRWSAQQRLIAGLTVEIARIESEVASGGQQ